MKHPKRWAVITGVFGFLLPLLWIITWFIITYEVIRCAVRDGIASAIETPQAIETLNIQGD